MQAFVITPPSIRPSLCHLARNQEIIKFQILLITGSYVQYRPVSYTHPERDVSTATIVRISEATNLNLNVASALNGSLAWSYYGSNVTQALVQGFNVSIGNAQDGFYSRTNYTTWYVSCYLIQ